VIAVAFAIAKTSFASTPTTTTVWSTKLSASAEIPKQAVKNAAGSGTFIGSLTGTKLSYTLTFAKLTGPATMAHIHLGAAGKSGGILVTLCTPCKSPRSGTVTVSAAVQKDFTKHLLYVNVHTAKNPNGEIRGQLAAAKPTTITVTAGKPAELAFKLSKLSDIPAGPVTFKVTNEGVAFHTFEICTTPVTSAAKNSCVGKVTKLLKHGQSATLTVALLKNGKYEFLCSVPGHAAAGMKGLLGIGVKVTAPVVTTTSTTTATTTTTTATTTPTTTTTGGGGVTTTTTAGGPPYTETDAACPPGKTIVSNGNTDADGDEQAAEPNDQDGCI
jgi:uncharacterized cupredoxin-like copper-binding protein